MALDFPSSPTNGQVYGNWIYSSAKGAWEAKPLTPGVAATSDTPPLTPKDGDVWYNTNDGSAYVYYVDVDGGQWVQIKSDATLATTLGTRVDSLEATRPGTTGRPWVMAAGTIANSNTGGGTSNGWYWTTTVTVTLPVGRFTAVPIVHAHMVAGVISTTYVLSSSTTNFTFGVARLTDYAGGLPVNWTAIQMTSTTGAG